MLLAMSASLFVTGCQSTSNKQINVVNKKNVKNRIVEELALEEKGKVLKNAKVEKEIVISAIGDCTLGTDPNFGYPNSFTNVYDEQDSSYFFKEVLPILERDDLTIANLEGTFTASCDRVEKTFNFKGDAEYTNILKEGSVEAVNIANNHTYDYGENGYKDTINNLENASIPYFGNGEYAILESKGITIGLAGIKGWNETEAKKETEKAITYFKEMNTDKIIVSYHWGVEREYKENTIQTSIGHYAIDIGADVVLGHHPHVLQGIEEYKGKYIAYSLGNFVFGGNKNPSDKNTMILQIIFHYENGKYKETSIRIIPCSLSGEKDRNNYQPVPLEEKEYDEVLKRILEVSPTIKIK